MEWAKVVGNNLIISLINIVYISHAMHPHDIHQSFLSEINPSLADQIAEKERLDSTDRFLWHGGIQKCGVIPFRLILFRVTS